MCATAPAKKRKPFLGLIYDRLARQQWEQRASHNEDGFDVNVECKRVDSAILMEAEEVHDRQVSEPQPRVKDDRERVRITHGPYLCTAGLLCLSPRNGRPKTMGKAAHGVLKVIPLC